MRNSYKFIELAKKLVVAENYKDAKYGIIPPGGCSQSRLIPCDIPIKCVVGSLDQYFIFDETRCIPLVTKTFLNMAESIGRRVLKLPYETIIYETHRDIEDIDELIAKAIPIVAQILEGEHLLTTLGFDDIMNHACGFNFIDTIGLEKYLTAYINGDYFTFQKCLDELNMKIFDYYQHLDCETYKEFIDQIEKLTELKTLL